MQAKEKTDSAFFDELLDSTAHSVFVVDVKTANFLHCNFASVKQFGYTLDELKKLHVSDLQVGVDLTTPELWRALVARCKSAKENKIVAKGQHKKKKGDTFPSESTITYLNKDNQDYLVVEVRNTLNRILLEDELFEARERLELVLEGSSDGFWDWSDVTGDEVWWSRKYYELLGYEYGEVKPTFTFFQSLLHPEDVQKMMEAIDACIEERSSIEMEYRLKTKTGEYRWFLGRGQVSRAETGNISRMSGSIQDITEQKKAYLELNKLTQYLDAILYNLPVGIAILEGADLTYFRINKVLAKMNGLSVDAHIGKPLLSVLPHTEETLYREMQLVMMTEKPVLQREFSLYLPGNPKEKTHLIDWLIPIMGANDQPNGIVAVVVDISDKKGLELALKKAHQTALALSSGLLEAQEAERARIARELHDDLGQVLLAQKMTLELMQKKAKEMDSCKLCPFIQGLLNKNKACMQTVRSVTHDLHPPMLEELGLSTSIEAEIKNLNASGSLKFQFDCVAELPELHIQATIAFYRIFQEATSNIIKHAEAKEASVLLRHDNASIILTISDDGVGFDQDDVKVAKSLGLANMRERVRLLEGEFILESNDQGTCLTVKTPHKGRASSL